MRLFWLYLKALTSEAGIILVLLGFVSTLSPFIPRLQNVEFLARIGWVCVVAGLIVANFSIFSRFAGKSLDKIVRELQYNQTSLNNINAATISVLRTSTWDTGELKNWDLPEELVTQIEDVYRKISSAKEIKTSLESLPPGTEVGPESVQIELLLQAISEILPSVIQGINDSRPSSSSTLGNRIQAVGQPLIKAICMILLLATGYVAIGSYLFGEWWFDFVWNKGSLELSQWVAFVPLIQEHPYRSAFLVIFGIMLGTGVVLRFGSAIDSILDRHRMKLIVASLSMMVAVSLVNYGNYHERMELRDKLMDALGNLASLAEEGATSLEPTPQWDGPIDFHFLDVERIEGLYSQLESRGIDKELSPEAKCTELMKYTVELGETKYITDTGAFFLRKIADVFEKQGEFWRKFLEGIDEFDKEIALLHEAGKIDIDNLESEVISELRALRGQVLVEGEFSIIEGQNSDLVLSRNIALGMPPIHFNTHVPQDALDTALFRESLTVKLKVFGTIFRPMGEDRVIEMRPLAVF